jgi:hypothetical protein
MELPRILIKDVLQCFQSEVSSARLFNNFQACIKSFGFSEDDDIVSLYYMILKDPHKFKDPNNYPKSWKCDSSRKAGVSAINRSLNISLVQSVLDHELIDNIRNALTKFINELTNGNAKETKIDENKKDIDNNSTKDSNEDSHEDSHEDSSDEELDSIDQHIFDEIKRANEANKVLHNKNKLLEIKITKLLEILDILTHDSPQQKALVNVSINILDML